jgi:hypothetical protein
MAVEYAPRHARSRARRIEAGAGAFARRFDWILFGGVVALVGYGLHLVGGITQHDIPGEPNYYVLRQGLYASAGFAGMIALSLVTPDLYRRYWRQLYAAVVLLLLIVIPLGTEARGSQRWIDLGPVTFQPSELGKLLVVLAVGGFLADRRCSSFGSRTSARRSSTGPPCSRCCSSRARAGCTSPRSPRSSSSEPAAWSGCCLRSGSMCSSRTSATG